MDHRLALDGRAVGLMTLLCVVWSLQQISLKAAAPDVGPMLMVALRSGLAALMVLALMRLRGAGEPLRPTPGGWRAGLGVGALFALEYLLVAQALLLTHAAHVVVFLYTAPIFAALGLHLKLPAERLHWSQWLGIGIAFVGIAVAFLGRSGAPAAGAAPGASQGVSLWGDALALAGGASWGATTVLLRCSALARAPATESLLYQLLCACVLLLPASLLFGQGHFSASPAAWAHLAFQSVVVSFASFLAWFWLLRHYLASRLGVFSFLTPVFGVLLGVGLLGEPLEAGFVAGSLGVLAGIVLVSGSGWLRRRADPRRT